MSQPEKLKKCGNNIEKFEAARSWCEQNGMDFEVVSPEYLPDEVMFKLFSTGKISFASKVATKADAYFTRKGFLK